MVYPFVFLKTRIRARVGPVWRNNSVAHVRIIGSVFLEPEKKGWVTHFRKQNENCICMRVGPIARHAAVAHVGIISPSFSNLGLCVRT